ncbi:hypothetical protein LB518_22685 [Mesorhizobium sp. BR1-1-16]|uniref:hypothetical protein n=1 Tax=Mesorhizobium sp. BR1-1-16 TaxID=2876653 RepID=UPI001CCF3F23|nr:hypothetical protein [Mesorhizobium sp. BR1-1-16]MBZ9939121.1 hypothetical protein [Mesorhizobium sp. BR1-1-16]
MAGLIMPVLADIDLWRGNDAPPRVWQTPDDFPLVGSVVVLTVYVGGDLLLSAASDDGASGLTIDDSGHFIAWKPSLAQSRLCPFGRIARYELERRYLGDQETLAYGCIVGLGGANLDD